MAQEGLFLEKDGISCGMACFQRGEPRAVHYRLESARTDPTAMEVLISGDTMMGVDPDEEKLEFHACYGWEYTGKPTVSEAEQRTGAEPSRGLAGKRPLVFHRPLPHHRCRDPVVSDDHSHAGDHLTARRAAETLLRWAGG